MELITLSTNEINQNGYHLNKLTRNKIGFIYTAPIKIVPDDCLACDGYVLKIADYKKLYSVIGKTFNTGTEAEDEFRIPDYNVTKRFLQPSQNVAIKIEAGLPNHRHDIGMDNYAGSKYGTRATNSNHKQAGWGSAAVNNLSGYTSYASDSNALYGKSSTVQPASHTVHLCIKYK